MTPNDPTAPTPSGGDFAVPLSAENRLELHHVEHLMRACGDSHDALMLYGTLAVVANVITQRDAAERANATPLVRCEACGFGYSAEHRNADGSYSCPLCELAAAEARAVRCEGVVPSKELLCRADGLLSLIYHRYRYEKIPDDVREDMLQTSYALRAITDRLP